jgi:hypothetical protein
MPHSGLDRIPEVRHLRWRRIADAINQVENERSLQPAFGSCAPFISGSGWLAQVSKDSPNHPPPTLPKLRARGLLKSSCLGLTRLADPARWHMGRKPRRSNGPTSRDVTAKRECHPLSKRMLWLVPQTPDQRVRHVSLTHGQCIARAAPSRM